MIVDMRKRSIQKGLFVGLLCALLTLLVARLFDVQLIHGNRFVQLAEDNRLFSLAVAPNRGVFLDRYNQPLVWNKRTYHKKLQPFSLYSETEAVSQEEGLQLLATESGSVERKVIRQYPYLGSLAHVLGYIGPVTAEDIEQDETLLPTEYIGKLGLERTFNQQLRGIPGSQVWEINARVSRQRQVSETPARDGQSVQTSLDPFLSEVAASAMEGKKGSVVIADAATGRVLSLVNSPSFDPNLFATVSLDEVMQQQRKQQIQAFFSDPDQPFFNRAVSGAYPPGSVFKLVTALAGLEEEAFSASTTVIDEGVLKVGEYQYGNWYYRQFGRTEGEIGLVRSIARSNDIFFYKAAEWIGVERLAAMAKLFGLGHKTGIELGPEAEGLVPTPGWKEQVIGEPWYLGNTYHMGIGQGDLLVSPVQVAQMVQTIANYGSQCRMSVLLGSESDCKSLGLREENVNLVLEGMLDACSPNGTAFPFFSRNGQLRKEGMTQQDALHAGAVACKTGTAEFGGANEKGYRDTHGWWVGIVEPQIDFDSLEKDGQISLEIPQAASSSATIPLSGERLGELKLAWNQSVSNETFPERLVIVVLVESDEQKQFREGSQDAAPVGEFIINWLES
jgi:penicillin-binding protein 2